MTTHEPATGGGSSAQPLVLVEHPARRSDGAIAEGVALVTLNRPAALNAINGALVAELARALEALDADDGCRCIVIRGSGERAFAAGADVREMADQLPLSPMLRETFGTWERLRRTRTPRIAAVRGYALGGGCELAMICDMIVAGDDAVFGQPEVKLGIIPGAGGTQRLTRAVGRARAMELVLTGRTMDAREAERIGLVTRVVPAAETFDAAIDLATRIAAQPVLAVRAAKEAVDRAMELPLAAGLDLERQAFFDLFSTEDQKEGMAAFIEKRPPRFSGR
jgi:enoyl-CoA hydratase